ncbi:hypothetical protein JCM6882_007314 [Rhodosporidiobolus microsporus]
MAPPTPASLQARQEAVLAQYRDNADLVRDVQRQGIAELLPALKDELDLAGDEDDEAAVGAGKALLQDRVSVFRFCRRARFSPTQALKLLHATLHWRLTSSLRSLTPASIPSVYRTHPLLFFHPTLVDRFGRPAAVLNLRHVQRTADGTLDELKEFVRLFWEVGRRYLTDLSRQAGEENDPKLQMVLIVDLEGAGMSNLEVELLPFFTDLLKNHFPGMVGGLFVLNYGWAYAGMWQLAKRVLPQTALDRILFPSKEELLEFFAEDHLLVEHGGSVQYEYTPSNPILEKYGRPLYPLSRPSSAYPSPGPTPSVSSASLHGDVFHSAPASGPPTPSHSRRPSSLAMTPATPGSKAAGTSGWPWNWGFTPTAPSTAPPESGGGLRRVRSLAELQQKLEQTRREIDSDDSTIDSASEFDDESTEVEQPARFEPDGSRATSVAASGRSSRFSSRATSRAVSREVSPMRRRVLEPLSAPAETDEAGAKTPEMHVMSPYNASNPHFGYPAYVPSSQFDPSGIPRPHHLRRRKRDLVRTLTYLAALRFLALHRAIGYRLNLVVAMLLRFTGLGWWQARRARALAAAEAEAARTSGVGLPPASSERKVHWAQQTAASPSPASSASSSSSSLSAVIPPQPHAHHAQPLPPIFTALPPAPPPPLPFNVDPTVIYLAFLFLLIRTPRRRDKVKRLVRFLTVGAPSWALARGRAAALSALLGKETAQGVLRQERAARGV